MRTFVSFLLAIVVLHLPAHAAGTSESGVSPAAMMDSITDQQLQLFRENIRTKRRQIIAANVPLTASESAKFWPVYDHYIAETIRLNDGRFALLKDYVAHYNAITPQQALTYIRQLMDGDQQMLDLRAKYMPLMQNAVGQRKAAMFAQVDRRVQLMVELQLASQIPLISPAPQ